MNDFETFLHPAPEEGAESESELRDLLQTAGERPALPARDFAELKEAARVEWRAMVESQRNSRRRWSLGLALAASLVLALGAAWWWRGSLPMGSASPVATVLKIDGAIQSSAGDPLEIGSTLPKGVQIETASDSGRLALRLAGGQSLRLDRATRVRLLAGDQLELERGAVYFDSAGAVDAANIEILTAFGTVRDIGTQFELRVEDAAQGLLRLRVREGVVALEHDGDSHSATRGEELRLDADGDVAVVQLPPYGIDWAWVLEAAPTFDIDGRLLTDYLDWVVRETGLTVSFEDPALETAAASVQLGGTIEALTVEESLSVVLPGSGMDYRLVDGMLLISAATDPS